MSVIRVALPVPLRQHFDYLLPDNLQVKPGCRVKVPFGKRQLVGIVWQLSPTDSYDSTSLKTIIEILDPAPVLADDIRQLLSFAADYYHYPLGEVLISALPALLREGKALPSYQTMQYQLSDKGMQATGDDFKRSARQLALWQALQHPMSEQQLLAEHQRTTLQQLQQKELISCQPQPYQPYAPITAIPTGHRLTTEQALAVTAISQAQTQFRCFLLEGITGSGKTEVYLQSIAPLLQQGQQVLVLVPEIGLTPQTLQRFQSRFNVPVLCWHSALTDTERLECWQQAGTGSAAIVIGTRSALFLPFRQLALIIIDEEHDSSLKQQDGFRYHARDLAIKRAANSHCPVVLGSATPSLESFYNVQQGRFTHLILNNRAAGQALPTYQLVNLQQQVLQHGLAGQTIAMIKQQLAAGFQVMLFLNRRGYAPALHCQECGWLTECSRCSAFSTYHKQSRQLVCHHCGSSKPLPRQCGHCGSTKLAPLGQGTEQLEEQLQLLFPAITVTRLDRDSTRRKGSLQQALDQIQQQQPQIILGTQMLAKGHHFPNVTLVVIVDVDGALFSSDFRAPEQLAQLLTQVAGRAGRGSTAGTVLLQTRYPDHWLLQDLLQNGYSAFAASALQERQQTRLPPCQYLALFRAEAHSSDLCQQWLNQLASAVADYPYLQLLGPLPAPMERRAGKYRWQLQLYSSNRAVLHQALQQLLLQLSQWPLSRKIKWQLDVDPVDLS